MKPKFEAGCLEGTLIFSAKLAGGDTNSRHCCFSATRMCPSLMRSASRAFSFALVRSQTSRRTPSNGFFPGCATSGWNGEGEDDEVSVKRTASFGASNTEGRCTFEHVLKTELFEEVDGLIDGKDEAENPGLCVSGNGHGVSKWLQEGFRGDEPAWWVDIREAGMGGMVL